MLELVLVMVLIGITMAFAVPRLSSFIFVDPLKQTARRLNLLITTTAQLAVRTAQPYLIEYESETRQFRVTAVEKEEVESGSFLWDDDTSDLPSLQLPDSVLLKDILFADREVSSTKTISLWLSDRGYLEPCLIHLQDLDGKEMTLVLSPFAGRITHHGIYIPLTEDTFR